MMLAASWCDDWYPLNAAECLKSGTAKAGRPIQTWTTTSFGKPAGYSFTSVEFQAKKYVEGMPVSLRASQKAPAVCLYLNR